MILCLDLGTKCGWVINGKDNGVWDLRASKFESVGRRYLNFKSTLEIAIGHSEVKTIFYEEVRNHRAIDAAHVYGGLVAVLQTVALERGIEYQGVPVGTIKKHATGKGNADKEGMVRAATKLFPSVNVIDDNHADALCLYSYVTNNLLF